MEYIPEYLYVSVHRYYYQYIRRKANDKIVAKFIVQSSATTRREIQEDIWQAFFNSEWRWETYPDEDLESCSSGFYLDQRGLHHGPFTTEEEAMGKWWIDPKLAPS